MYRQRLLGIQLARGAAALLVAFYHANRMAALPQYAAQKPFGNFLEFGHAGVDFFFVLSGFIIYFVHHSEIGSPPALKRYTWRRITRIYPSYWFVTAFLVAIMVAKHDPELTSARLFRSLLLLPGPDEPLLGVAWTLVHEVLFYSVFAMAILSVRVGAIVGILWVILIATGIGTRLQDATLHVLGAYRNLEFLVGIIAAHIVLTFRVPRPTAFLALGIVGFFVSGAAENAHLFVWDGPIGNTLFGGFSGIAIVGLAAAERNGALKIGRIGEFFGGTSYLLYLVHTIAIGMTLWVGSHLGVFRIVPAWLIVILAVAVSATVASLLYQFFEVPVLRGLGNFGRRNIFPGPKHQAAPKRA